MDIKLLAIFCVQYQNKFTPKYAFIIPYLTNYILYWSETKPKVWFVLISLKEILLTNKRNRCL